MIANLNFSSDDFIEQGEETKPEINIKNSEDKSTKTNIAKKSLSKDKYFTIDTSDYPDSKIKIVKSL